MEMRHVKVGVTPYAYKYISRTYGPTDKFDLTSSYKNDLRISLINLDYTAMPPLPSEGKRGGSFILFDLGSDPSLINAYIENQKWLKVRSYFEHEFNVILKNYLEAQADFADKMGLSQSQYNARIGLETFLEKYEISESEYSYDSLRRQWNRLRQKDRTYFYAFLSRKLQFLPIENQPIKPMYFSPARIVGHHRKKIWFMAYSRSKEDIVIRELSVPHKLILSGDWVEWSDIVIQAINSLLRKGYSVK